MAVCFFWIVHAVSKGCHSASKNITGIQNLIKNLAKLQWEKE